jgi:16S rRNA processing protein RimM
VAVGIIHRAHGVRGELSVESLSDAAGRFAKGAALWIDGERYEVQQSRPLKRGIAVKLAGIDSREAAEALRGKLLEIPEATLEALGEGEYYRFQLIGLEVVDGDGRALGRLEEVLATGSNDVYVVRGPAGELLLPATDDVVRKVDVAAGRMVVELIEGLGAAPSREGRV